MKLLVAASVLFLSAATFASAPTSEFLGCENTVVDSLTKKELIVMAKRYDSSEVGVGVSILNGTTVTTSVAIFAGKGGNDGIKVDRIGSITIDLEKCAMKNTLIGTFDVLKIE